MNYIGSKLSLLPSIENVIRKAGMPLEGIALDLFAGTGIVAQQLKSMGFTTYANDLQWYSRVTTSAFIECNAYPVFDRLFQSQMWQKKLDQAHVRTFACFSSKQRDKLLAEAPCSYVLSYLQSLSGTEGLFYHTYCEGGSAGRQYFSRQNGLHIQAIRDQIEDWWTVGLLTPREKNWLVATLIEGADRVANTASVYGAYLKQVKASAQHPLQLIPLLPVPSRVPESQHKVFNQDSSYLVKDLAEVPIRLVYIDPPYNARQYASNYHILETLARWDLDQFEPRGVTGLRPREENQSQFCLRTKVFKAFDKLLSAVRSEYILFSYSNEGLVSEVQLSDLFSRYFQNVQFNKIRYQRFRSDIDHERRVYKTDYTEEFLILAQSIQHQSQRTETKQSARTLS